MDNFAANSFERNSFDGSRGGSIAQDGYSGSVDSIKDVLSARDPTLVLLQKPMIGSSSAKEASATNLETCKESSYDVTDGLVRIPVVNEENDLDIEHGNEGSSSHDGSSLFSFGTGMLKTNSQKVRQFHSLLKKSANLNVLDPVTCF